MATSDIQGDIEQTKRRQAGGLPVGIGLPPEQQKTQADAEWRRGSLQRQAEFKQGVGRVVGGIGDAMGQVARTATTTAGAGLNALRNTTFDSSLPNYSTPAKEAEKQRNAQQRAAGWVAQNPQVAEQARAGMQGIADRAVHAGKYTPLGDPLRPIPHSSAPGEPGSGASRASAVATGGAPGGQPSAPTSDQPAPADLTQSGGLGQWSRTGIGAGRNGGEIVGRMGANGVPEFSNREADAKGAGPRRATGRVGDGIGGGISYGEAGDSQLSIDRVERARAIEVSRRGGVGESGGLTVVGTGGPDAMELARQRRLGISPKAARAYREQQLAEAGLGLRRQELEQQSIDAGLDRALREREMAGAEQRTQQEIEAGQLSLAQQRRVADLYARYEQAAPEERAALAEQIRTLTGKETPNRFTVVPGGQEYDSSAGALVNRPARVLNNQTGQFIEQSSAGGSTPQLQADLAQARRIIAADPSKRAEVERRFQEAYGRGLEG